MAKRIPLGGVDRHRISSQCLKYHWRTYEGPNAIMDLGIPAYRSREIYTQKIEGPLLAEGFEPEKVGVAVTNVIAALKGKKPEGEKKSKRGKKEDENPLKTEEPVVLLPHEVDVLLSHLRDVLTSETVSLKIVKKDFDTYVRELNLLLGGLKNPPSGLDAALFGRMTSGSAAVNIDAAIHVAHAITTHPAAGEADYFTVVDNLAEEAGASHLNATDLTSSVYYGYVVVDLDLLRANLHGESDLAAEVIKRLIHVVSTACVGAKKGSTAPYSRSSTVLVEVGEYQPRSLAPAFSEKAGDNYSVENSHQRLLTYRANLMAMYGEEVEARIASLYPSNDIETASIPDLARWVSEKV